jgi:hypothetical protein
MNPQIDNKTLIEPPRLANLTDIQIKKLVDANLIFYCDDCECYHSTNYPKITTILEEKP